MDIPKKKVVIKVRPHTISVGPTKPTNGGKGTDTPIQPVQVRRSLFSKVLEVVKEDFSRKKKETEAVVGDAPTWEEYLRFREMAKK